jgi:RecB family endonuclease NucS
MAIIQTADIWQFGNEFELEEVLWQNLPKLLNLKPFKRQYSVRGQFCDILATDDQQCLVVLELKNVEDRYVVQQLTRYYDALKEEDPFEDEVDLSQPIRLIAIAPSFHQDTLIDCKYSRLEIELVSFQIQARENNLYLELASSGIDEGNPLLLQATGTPSPEIAVPEPSRKLLNWLSYASEADFKTFIATRQQILSFDERMKEVVESQRFRYGKGKTKPCAEIVQVKPFSEGPKQPTLVLWLPAPEGKTQVLRMLIETDSTGSIVNRLLYCPRKTKAKDWWLLPQFNKFGTDPGNIPPIYQPLANENGEFTLSILVELALNNWLERIQ